MGRTSSGTILLAFVAILCGLLGTYAVRKLARPRIAKAEAKAGPDSIVVPMASTDLPAGRKITLGDIGIVRMTRKQMKDRNVKSPFMSNTSQIIGRTLKEELHRGDTFDTSYFYSEGLGPGVAERLEPGERAVTVSIANENGVIGFAGAGQFVDVLFHAGGDFQHHRHRSRGSGYGYGARGWGGGSQYGDRPEDLGATSTLMQGVRVLALGNDTFAPVSKPKDRDPDMLSVTLAVTPAQAEILRVVQGHGELSLTLRNPSDHESVDLNSRRTLNDVLDLPVSKTNEMEIYRGQHVNRLFFDRTSSISHKMGGRGANYFGQDQPAAQPGTTVTNPRPALQAQAPTDNDPQ